MKHLFTEGQFSVLHAEGEMILFCRQHENQYALVAINHSGDEQKVKINIDCPDILQEFNGSLQVIPDELGDVRIEVAAHSVSIFHNTCYEAV